MSSQPIGTPWLVAASTPSPSATNTSQNLTYTRQILDEAVVQPTSVMLITRPYQQRRAYATCRRVWPEVDIVCASRPLPLDDYKVNTAYQRLAAAGYTRRLIQWAGRS
jgi:uncharacterized SAM-binding protein YcdF (DUF218 family)